MSLLRACLAFCFLAVAMSAGADAIDDWLRERHADSERTFQQCLENLKEEQLDPLARDRSREAYRMVYLPSFFPQVSMRVNVSANGAGRLTLRRIWSYCGRINQPVEEKQVALSAADVAVLKDAYARADFWNRVKIEGRDGADGIQSVVCSDGASVYFEAVRDGLYHRINRSCLWVEAIEDIKVVFHRLAREQDPHRAN